LAPRAPKVPPMIEKSTKNDIKEPPDYEKELPKSSFLGTWPGGLREALTINYTKNTQTNWNLIYCCFILAINSRITLNSIFLITRHVMLPRKCLDSLEEPQK
jgi:hypothetical protein